MNNHPSRRGEDDPTEAAALARVNSLRAARGLEPIVERDPLLVCRDLLDDRDAAMIAVAVLRRAGCGAAVPDAVDYALAATPPVAAANMPYAVASALFRRVPEQHRGAVWDAVDAVLHRFDSTDGNRALAELCLHHIADAVRAGITATIAAELAGAVDHDGRPVPDEQITDAAAGAAEIAVDGILDRLRADLLALAVLP
ncbi:hypothetical protein [Mycobacterium sp. 29Ha]|uniref:hypothetical protein n=1 Tax=Mycobacterium sp. 29Ha TaxID=2939268 RepID=UPI002938E068|nr:hypothetical protein [Mycobacterium sp. 29Ha]MDV3136751.1 hypothetical protein [Mycobacterium sp. 29Ha]